MTERLQGSSLQISSILVGIAGFACAAITFGYYGKPQPTDGGLWYFYLLCIIAFFLGHLFFLRFWVAAGQFNSVRPIINSVASFALPVGLVLIPEVAGFSGHLPPNTLAAYHIAEAYLFTVYSLVSFNLYMHLLRMRHHAGKARFIEGFYALLVLASLYFLVGQFMPSIITICFYVATGIGIAYLTTRLNWLSLVHKKDKVRLALLLFLVNVVNSLMLYHYITEREHYLFSVNESLPEVIFVSSMGFVTVYGLMAFLALLFYLPVADIVDQQTRELEGLMEISESARQRENVHQVFDRMFAAAMRDTGSDAGWMWFKVDKQDAVVKTKNVNLHKVNSFRDVLEPLLQGSQNAPLYVPDMHTHDKLSPLGNGFRSMLALPISNKEVELGMLCLFKNQTNGFDLHMINMGKTYVNFALNAYENQQVLEETLRNEQVLEEYKLARQIQQRLIPATLNGQNGWSAVTFLEPSKKVGGDFYDSFVLDENRTALVIGDVSGNGMPAALHMAELKGIFQSLTAFSLSPKELVMRANAAISACFEKNRFVTLIYLVIDKKERKFTYIRAGHCPVLYFDGLQNEASYIKDEGLGLGILRNKSFESHIHVYERQYKENDMLALFTDGIDEAIDPRTGEAYGFDRLKNSLVEAARYNALDMVMKGMLADMRRHVKDNKELDDMTMILLRFD